MTPVEQQKFWQELWYGKPFSEMSAEEIASKRIFKTTVPLGFPYYAAMNAFFMIGVSIAASLVVNLIYIFIGFEFLNNDQPASVITTYSPIVIAISFAITALWLANTFPFGIPDLFDELKED